MGHRLDDEQDAVHALSGMETMPDGCRRAQDGDISTYLLKPVLQ